MATVATYVNLPGTVEEAFTFYAGVFGTEIMGIVRMGDVPPQEGQPEMPEDVKNLIMNAAVPILGGHILMGTDITGWMGGDPVMGNAYSICLSPDSREEADRLFAALSDGGKVGSPMKDEFWGDYYGDFIDRFGVAWMINQSNQPAG
jgi:PhnB protein